MKPSRTALILAAWLVAPGLVTVAAASLWSPWLRLDEEELKRLPTELARIEAEVKSGKLSAEAGEQITKFTASRLRELERELPVRRRSSEMGRTDARRDLAQGKVRCFVIDEAFFPGVICTLSEVSQNDWNHALQKLTGATVLPVKPQAGNLWLLAARVDGYNEVVWAYLTNRHGADIFKRVEAHAMRAGGEPGLWVQTWEGAGPFIPLLAASVALLLLARLGRLLESRKQRHRISANIGAT